MKRPHCNTCHNRMKGHKRRRCTKYVRIVFDDNSLYHGAVYNSQPSGTGTLTTPDGLHYSGLFKNGKKHGYGVEIKDGGHQYMGEWMDDHWSGQGKLTLSNGTVYEGSFAASMYNGTGTLTKTESYSYEGDWVNGSRHGHGIEKTSTETYIGHFSNNHRHGDGSSHSIDGTRYNGQWRRGHQHGHGRESTRLSVYQGRWLRGQRCGQGSSNSVVSGEYTGTWRNGKRHGHGVNVLGDIVYNGHWKNGMCHGTGTICYENGYYSGHWYENEHHGEGELEENGTIFTGRWQYGHRQGEFEEKTEGRRYKGTYENDVRHGTFVDLESLSSKLYIWGTPVEFQTKREARKTLKSLMKSDDFLAASVVAEYVDVVTWNLLYKYDTEGRLLHFLETDIIQKKIIKYAWKLFQKKRYAFLETMVAKLDLSEMDSLLFDSISNQFVANPWVIREQSYSEETKQKLLDGLHLGEFGRCPPKDPFTREPLSENSGNYLSDKSTLAKRIYRKFAEGVPKTPSVREMAYSFDMEDLETMLKHAREANDRETIRKLLKERNDYMLHNTKKTRKE